jgi:hypothetical protein
MGAPPAYTLAVGGTTVRRPSSGRTVIAASARLPVLESARTVAELVAVTLIGGT